MNWSQELRAYTAAQLARRREWLPRPLAEELAACGEEERPLFSWLCATLPAADLGDYPPRLFREAAREALLCRREFAWCAALPENLFLLHVLCPRVNNEELSPCRELFRRELSPRVAGLSLEEAILEVNRWCAEHVTYRSTDDRTSSALEVYRRGYGRCGEESTFLTAALRSVGVAARQVYAPWWSHCDDNHAWVEAFDGSAWRYLGACEPEPLLDRGWFTHAAARAVMVHTRAFVQGSREEAAFLFPERGGWDLRQGVATENLTPRYARTKRLTVEVVDGQGAPARGVEVSFSVMNMAAPREVARRTTGSAGQAALEVGKGALLLCAWDGAGPLAEAVVPPERESVRLVLGRELSPGQAEFPAPADGAVTVSSLSREQAAARAACLEKAAACRARWTQRWRMGQPPAPQGDRARVWASLPEKDRDGVLSEALWQDALEAFAREGDVPPSAFEKGLLSPRVGWETLTPWHTLLAERFSPEQRETYRGDPAALWPWVESRVSLDRDGYAALWGTPAGALSVGRASPAGRALLFCAACRALGVPAYLEEGVPWFWRAGAFHPLWGGEPTARLALLSPRAALPGQDYTLSRRTPQGWRPVAAPALLPGEQRELSLAPGRYRLWTVTRLPSGHQLGWQVQVSLEEGADGRLVLAFRQGRPEEMLSRCPLPDFPLWEEDGRRLSGLEALGEAPLTALCFLEPGREPTEHLLNELRQAAPALAAAGLAPCFVVEDFAQRGDPTLQKALAALPGARLLRGDFPQTVPALARRTYLDPERLPLALLVNGRGESLYGCCGYNVGTAALLLGLSAAARGESAGQVPAP